jgi:serine/threonine protein kinase
MTHGCAEPSDQFSVTTPLLSESSINTSLGERGAAIQPPLSHAPDLRLVVSHSGTAAHRPNQRRIDLPEGFSIIESADLEEDSTHEPERKGSFGEVHKCIWKGLVVAVKKLKSHDAQEKFVQEATMMNRIQHTNCVRLFGACRAPRQAIVMEWMGGGDLEQYLQQRPLPPLHRRISLFRQVCAGLNALHSHSPSPIIHSDLKPANILLDEDKKVAKISDFGLAKIRSASYGSAHNAGTLLYNAPEVLLKCEPAHRCTDIYAMGLVLWEMLAGKRVWHHRDGSPFLPVQLIAALNQQHRPPLDDLPANIDPALISLMQSCWAEDPSQRPTSSQLWKRMAALDLNNPDNNTALALYPDNFAPLCHTLEDCLRCAMGDFPHQVLDALLRDMPCIDRQYRSAAAQSVVRAYCLSEVEAKCIIMFTHECVNVPDHPSPSITNNKKRDYQFYFVYNAACRHRDSSTVKNFQNFSFHFLSALRKLPSAQFAAGEKLYTPPPPTLEPHLCIEHVCTRYRGFGPRVQDMNDLYCSGADVCWHQTSSATTIKDVAYRSFASGRGTLMELVGVCDAKDISSLSMFPTEGEYTILHNTRLKVRVALSCDEARLLDEQHKLLPDNVDLIILEQCDAQ